MKRREFLRVEARVGAAVGLALLADRCAHDTRLAKPEAAPAATTEAPPTLEGLTAAKPGATKVLPGVWASVGLETVYYIRCGDRAVMVDSGFRHNVETHLRNFEAAGLNLASVDAVLATHAHVDHAGGLSLLRRTMGCPVVAHRNAADAIRKGDRVVTAAEMPFLQGWSFAFPPCEVDEAVEDGDSLVVGPTRFRVVHLPGHTPGCAGYLWDGHLVTGDTVFPGGSLGWYDAHWGSNLDDAAETMDRIADLAPRWLLPSHLLPFPYENAITDRAAATCRRIRSDGSTGAVAFTQRAPKRANEMVRRIRPARRETQEAPNRQ